MGREAGGGVECGGVVAVAIAEVGMEGRGGEGGRHGVEIRSRRDARFARLRLLAPIPRGISLCVQWKVKTSDSVRSYASSAAHVYLRMTMSMIV